MAVNSPSTVTVRVLPNLPFADQEKLTVPG